MCQRALMGLWVGIAIVLSGCAYDTPPGVVKNRPVALGDGRYMVSVARLLSSSPVAQEAAATKEARRFCRGLGMDVHVLSTQTHGVESSAQVAAGQVVFECLPMSGQTDNDVVVVADGVYKLAGEAVEAKKKPARFILKAKAERFCARQGLKSLPIEDPLEGSLPGGPTEASMLKPSTSDLFFRCVAQ